ncbi:hypothetical protein BJ973_004228 [Actinoplanes tereljensis]|uniref:Uncharacterized protein n=1 Tax=Paractinoplanes tereljensis TaxID=571912 RepID=A0A919NR59_9ACTN|nr:hypothetical protein [Actinoplanes tereljensis]GIF23619.1 hypothetical protein Ate02nite_63490 [Actinoplanes tereljensis]
MTDVRSEPDPFSFESVVRRRPTDREYVPLHIIMAAAREPGTVVGFSLADFTEIMRKAGMLGLRDANRFIGDFVFGFFPAKAPRTYLTWPAPFLLVPASLGVDVGATVAAIRRQSAGRRLELKPGVTAELRIGAGVADFDGVHDDAVVDAIERLNEDLRRLDPDSPAILPEPDDWRPFFPADRTP